MITQNLDHNNSRESSCSEQNVTHDGYKLIPNGRFCSNECTGAPVEDTVARHMSNVKLWTEFNKKLPYFEEFYDGKSESFLLQSIFLQTNNIAKNIGVNYNDVPVGIFCSTKEDLAKLDELLARIDHRLRTQNQRRTILPSCENCTIL